MQESLTLPGGWLLRRRSHVADQAFIAAVGADTEHLGRWLAWARQPPTAEETAFHRARQDADWDAGNAFVFVITPADRTDRVLGGCALYPNGAPGVREIGYWVCSPHTGRGLATQAAAALTTAGLALPGITRTEIHCDRANTRSAAVPRRLGYRLDRIEPDEPQTPAEIGLSMVWQHDA
jgi:RimJ/RimL family protein N-acetyltransferase